MPSPLASLTPDEQYLYGSLAADPLSDLSPMLADAAEDRSQHARAELLRGQSRLPLLELLRGKALTERESAEVAARIRALLLTQQPASAVAERELAAVLGAPMRGDAMLALLDPEGNLDPPRLREQYDFQVTLLASLGLLDTHGGHLGISGLDDRFHPLPSPEAVQARLNTPALRRKVAQGFGQLLLVPFALPLKRLLEAWKRDLLRNERLLGPHGGLNREQPLWTWEHDYGLRAGQSPDQDGRLAYFWQRFAGISGGWTKAQLLAADPSAAWQVLLTEGTLTNLPLAGEGQILAGRLQIEAGRTPRQYLAALQDAGEIGWTPETYATAFLTTMERAGVVLDNESLSYLIASFPGSGLVPRVYWDSHNRQALLGGLLPGRDDPDSGARAAVRVV